MAALTNCKCLFNSRTALYRVFVSTPTALREAPPRQLAAAGHVLHSVAASSSPSTLAIGQVRTYAGGPSRRGPRGATGLHDVVVEDSDRGFSRLFTTAEDIERSRRDRMPQDHEIKDPKIMVLENGSVAGPLSTRYVMSKLDQETESLRMIRPYIPAGGSAKGKGKGSGAATAAAGGAEAQQGKPASSSAAPEQFALCQIVNKFEEFLKEKERKEKKKASAKPKSKELEMTWSIGEHDLQTKMRQLSGFLAKGMKVDLVLGRKKGSKPVDQETMAALVKKIKKEVVETMGARETKPAEGELGRTMRLHLEGIVKKQQ